MFQDTFCVSDLIFHSNECIFFLKPGHVHLTDFNVATVMEDENTLATSMSGTKPYMGELSGNVVTVIIFFLKTSHINGI